MISGRFIFTLLAIKLASQTGQLASGALTVVVPGNDIRAELVLVDTATCLVMWGDDIVTTVVYTSGDSNVQHDYTTPDMYTIVAVCFTEVDIVVADTELDRYVGDSISGVDIQTGVPQLIMPIAVCPMTADLALTGVMDQGTNVTTVVTHKQLGTTKTFTDIPFDSPYNYSFTMYDFDACGLHALEFVLTNPLPNEPVKKYVLLAVQNTVDNQIVGETGGELIVEIGQPFTVDVTYTGEDVTHSIAVYAKLAPGVLLEFHAIYCPGTLAQTSIPLQLDTPDVLTIEWEASNFVSSSKRIADLRPVYKVDSFELQVTDRISFNTDEVTFTLTAPAGINMPLGNVVAYIEYGDNPGAGPADSLTFDLTALSLPVLSKNDFRHTYSQPGRYVAKIVLVNGIAPNQTFDTDMIIEYVMSDSDITDDYDVSPHPWSRPWGVEISSATAKQFDNVNITINFDDGTEDEFLANNIINNVTPVRVTHRFPTSGKFSVQVGLVTYRNTINLSPVPVEVVMDCWEESSFFDSQTKVKTTPRIFYASETVPLLGSVRFSPNCSNSTDSITFSWKSYDASGALPSEIPYAADRAVDTNLFIVEKETLEEGLYMFELEVCMTDVTPPGCLTDLIYLQCLLPDLVVVIDGVRDTALIGSDDAPLLLDAGNSYDPVAGLPSLAEVTPTRSWRCATAPLSSLTDLKVQEFFGPGQNIDNYASDPCIDSSETPETYTFRPQANTPNQWYLICHTFTISPRETTKCTALKPVAGHPPHITIKCVHNCNDNPACTKIRFKDIQVDVQITEAGVLNYTATYRWYLYFWNQTTSSYQDITHRISGPVNRVGLYVEQSILEYGGRYQLFIEVKLPNRELARTSVTYIINTPPYAGTCDVNMVQGIALTDTFCMTCRDWKDEGNKDSRDAADSDMNLLYTLLQETEEDEGVTVDLKVPESTQREVCAPLTAGKKVTNITLLIVRVMDNCKDYASVNATLEVRPFLDPSRFSGSSVSAEAVEELSSILDDVQNSIQTADATGDSHRVNNLMDALAQSIENIEVPQPEAPVDDRPALSSGNLGDVMENGTALDVDDILSEVLERKPIDNTTQIVQNTKMSLIVTAMNKVNSTIENGTSATKAANYIQSSQTMRAALKGPQQNLNADSKDFVIEGINKISNDLSQLEADSPDTEAAKQALLDLLEQAVKSVVPEALSDVIGLVADQIAAGTLNDVLFGLADNETRQSIEDAVMSRDARDYTTAKLQRIAAYTVQQELGRLKDISDAKVTMVEQVQDTSSLCVGCEKDMATGDLAVKFKKDEAGQMASQPFKSGSSSLQLPGLEKLEKQIVSAAVVESPNTLYPSTESSKAASITSKAVQVISRKTISGDVTYTQQVAATVYTHIDPNVIIDEEDASEFVTQQTIQMYDHNSFCISIIPSSPDDIDRYWVYVKGEDKPTLIDYSSREDLTLENDFIRCFAPQQLQTSSMSMLYYSTRVEIKDVSTTVRQRRDASTTSNTSYPTYQVATASVACLTHDGATQDWDSTHCSVEWFPSESKIKCTCKNPTTLTFANSFYVGPNKIDFSSVFLKFSPLNQAAVMGTLVLILIVYILLILWARHQDKKDVLKWGITPLADNFPEDNYFYVMKVYTGMRPGAGTCSKIGFVLCGDELDTGVRELYDGVRQEYTTGSIVNFLLATPSFLGSLEYMRVWHDNSGDGDKASWYLSKIELQDVQRNENFTFLAERWLAIDKEDGALERVVPVCGKENMNLFRNRFFNHAKENVSESHIWLSVMYRPSSSNFTRVQRVSCALVFIMLAMISNAMFFKGGENYVTPSSVQVGPFRFSFKQVYISFVCALITTPATLVIIYVFRLSRSKLKTEHDLYQNPKKANRYKIPFMESWLEKRQRQSIELEKNLVAKGYPKFTGFYFPYWTAYIAWFLVFATVFLSGFFVMLYSMEWGKQKSEEWLTTFFMSFFESVLCLDPVKVAVMAFVFAIIFRSLKESDSLIDRKTIMKNYSGTLRGKSSGVRLPAPPLDEERLKKARDIRQREVKMQTALKGFLMNCFCMWILFSISYSNRDNRSYYLHRDVVDKLLTPTDTKKFEDIKTINGFFEWMNKTAIPNLFPENDFNGDRLHWRQRQFMIGGAAYRLGPPRLRQLRTTKDTCHIPMIGTVDCYEKYSEPGEETGDYCIGWKAGPCDPAEEVYDYSAEAWKFTSAFDIWGLPISGFYTTYGGGGYIGKLSVNRDISTFILNELYMKSWVDRQTRSVVFEFTLYCINANIFSYNMFMVEFPETGGSIPYYYILPLRVYQHVGALGIYTLVCEVLYLLIVLLLTIKVAIGIYRQKRAYFKKFWQTVDFVSVIGSYLAIIMYAIRFAVTETAIAAFQADDRQFVNFYHIALWDTLFVLLLGILVFITTLRLIDILGYNKRIGAVARVFTNAASDLIWFGIFFTYIFVLYAVFGTLLFGAKLESYRNVYTTLGTLFISMIGKSRFTEIENSDPIMSKIYFMCFIFFVVYLILTMFLAVLSKSIDQVHADTKNDKDDEMVDFILTKFKTLVGIGRAKKKPALERQDRSAPWRAHVSQLDNKTILQDIRTTLTDAFGPKGQSEFDEQTEKERTKFRQ